MFAGVKHGFTFRRTLFSMVTLALAARCAAIEVVVYNDSLEDLQFATIVAGFIAGEEGGSRLTMPCDGNIVAVQVLWWAGDAGAPPHLGNNIWIRRGESFPTPGVILEQLEGPVFQPFALNEFRFLDENQTLPLQVGVLAGQTLLVSVEFGESTLPTTGSVVRDNNGCQPGRNALFAPNLGGWLDFCSFPIFLQGDLVIRAVVDCQEPTGACCLTTGGCQDGLDAGDCAAISGTYQDDNSVCANVDCPKASEACCFMGGGCIDLTPSVCAIAEGFSQGIGSTCAAVECFPTGACCLPDGACSENVLDQDCIDMGGVFQGSDSLCSGVSCPQPTGACCLTSGNCLVLEQADCAQIPNSSWPGAGTDCTDADTNGTADACETGCNDPTQDIDGDCDVDLDDFSMFFGCASGDGVIAAKGCECFDADRDGDVDMIDAGAMFRAFTGEGTGCP